MDIRNMDSIWVEDEQSSKFYLNDPNLKILNSQVPMLSSKENIELPPLPPSSFFSYSLPSASASANGEPSKKKLLKMFKKLGLNNPDQSQNEVKKVKRKISTPFGFNHISHIDNQASAINVNKLAQLTPQEPIVESSSTPKSTGPQSNRTSTSAKAFCTSPQVNATAAAKQIPRSISNATSLSRTSSSHLFTRSGSISTMATTISSKTHSKKGSIPVVATSYNVTTSNANHQHQDSSSSIENLKKLEKNQISKQCSIDYSSNFKFPVEKNHQNQQSDLINWGTPDPQSAVRQSWIYEDLSPMKSPLKIGNRRANSISGGSPSYSPYRSDLNLFQNEVETTFNKDSSLNDIINSIDDFTKFFKPVSQEEGAGVEQDEEDGFNETIASLRAAKFSRLSRLENFYQNDPRYLSFIEEFQKTKTNSTDLSSKYSKSNSIDLKDFAQVPEILEYDSEQEDTEEESTPRQHHISTLLPSMM